MSRDYWEFAGPGPWSRYYAKVAEEIGWGLSFPPNPLGHNERQDYCADMSAGQDSFRQSEASPSTIASRLRYDYCYAKPNGKPKRLLCSENKCSKNILFSVEKSFQDEYWMFLITWLFIILVS